MVDDRRFIFGARDERGWKRNECCDDQGDENAQEFRCGHREILNDQRMSRRTARDFQHGGMAGSPGSSGILVAFATIENMV